MTKDTDRVAIENWLDAVLLLPIPSQVVAFCFNLYETEGGGYAIDLIGAASYSDTDNEWACDTVFSPESAYLNLPVEYATDTSHPVIQLAEGKEKEEVDFKLRIPEGYHLLKIMPEDFETPFYIACKDMQFEKGHWTRK